MDTSFFVHLTEVLGGDEFLAPISMLLVEKVAGRVVRQPQSDAQTSLSVPLSILHHYGSATQAQVGFSWLSLRTQIIISIRHSKKWCKRVGGFWDMHSSWRSLSQLSWTSRGTFTTLFAYRALVDYEIKERRGWDIPRFRQETVPCTSLVRKLCSSANENVNGGSHKWHSAPPTPNLHRCERTFWRKTGYGN